MFLGFPYWLWILLGLNFLIFLGAMAYEFNMWFPKTLREVRKENIENFETINNQLDLYTQEMRKRSSGIFNRRPRYNNSNS